MQSAQLSFRLPCAQPLQSTHLPFRLPCAQLLQSTHLPFSLPCGQPLQSAQLRFSLPCGQGLQSAQLRFSLPCGQGSQSAQLPFSLPCGQGLQSAQLPFSLPCFPPLPLHSEGPKIVHCRWCPSARCEYHDAINENLASPTPLRRAAATDARDAPFSLVSSPQWARLSERPKRRVTFTCLSNRSSRLVSLV